ncbi:MAG: hypothetical protein ACE5QF_05485 [Thermoplasmata archaeon]
MKLICPSCQEAFDTDKKKCPKCGDVHQVGVPEEEKLLEESRVVAEESEAFGLGELVGAIDSVILQIAPGRIEGAVKEFREMTPLELAGCYENEDFRWCVMSSKRPPRFIVREARRKLMNPFSGYNMGEKTREDTDTRLETFVFEVSDIEKLFEIQKSRGVSFLTEGIVDSRNYRFVQTAPSRFAGNSVGYIQWEGEEHDYAGRKDEMASLNVGERTMDHVQHLDYMDHTATRVRANDRIEAIKEWLTLLPYDFQFSVYVKNLNSITNVTRMVGQDYAQVFTTGITPYQGLSAAFEPTERFIIDYGTRVHHVAWSTWEIEEVVHSLKEGGQRFLVDLIGSEDEGLKQTFTVPSDFTMLVTEYIHRYPGFDGFFTRSNVTELTRATALQ